MLAKAGNGNGGGLALPFFFRASAGLRVAQAAFTFLELVVVLVLMGALAAITVPKFETNLFKGTSEADRFANEIRYVQSLAMTQGQRHLVQITAPRSYVFKTGSGVQVKSPNSGTTSTVQTLDSTVSFGTLVNITASSIGFDGRGVPYTGVSALTAVTLQMSIPIVSGSNTRTVTVDPESGRVTVQ